MSYRVTLEFHEQIHPVGGELPSERINNVISDMVDGFEMAYGICPDATIRWFTGPTNGRTRKLMPDGVWRQVEVSDGNIQ